MNSISKVKDVLHFQIQNIKEKNESYIRPQKNFNEISKDLYFHTLIIIK